MDGSNQPRILTEDDFQEVYCELVNIKARYYQLGIVLGLPLGELEAIRKTHSQDVEQALTQVLLLWLRQQYNFEKYGRPTGQKLREAVGSPSGGNNHALAEKIAEKYLASCCSNGSASHHPVGNSFHPISQPGVTQPGFAQLGVAQPGVTQPGVAQLGVAQPGVTQPGVMQPGVAQWRVVQRGAPQLHNAPQYMAAGFQMSRRFPGVSGCNIALPTGPPRLNHPVGYSFHPLPQPAGVSAQPPQCMPPGFQMFGFPGAAGYSPGPSQPHYVHSQPPFRPTSAQFPMMGGASPFQPSYQYHPNYQPGYPPAYNRPQGATFRSNFPQGYGQPAMHLPSTEADEGPPSKKFKRTPSAQPPIGQIQLSTDMQQQLDLWRRKIAASYLAEEFKSDAWPPLKIVNFVQLALVQQEKRTQHLDLHTIKSDIDTVYGQKVNIKYDELFQNIDHSSLFLIEGRPGSGKTTLLVRISCDWAKGNIAKSKLIIFVRLRYLDKTRDIYLHHLLRLACRALTPNDIHGLSSYIEGRLGEDIIFMLDGFDECGVLADADDFICHLIEGKIFSRSTVILSSRPAATQGFRQIATQWIEVVGFMKEQVMQYIQTYYEHDKEKGLQLEQHLNNHTNVLNLCYLPIYCAMLVHLYEQESLLPETETEFYRYFTLSSIFRTISKSTKHNIDKLTSFDQLPPEEKSVFDKICHLAFRATVESRQVFKRSEISDICGDIGSINEQENPGLLVIDRCLATVGYDSKYSFLHLTLQEYLSAVYIAERVNSEQVSIVKSFSDKNHLDVMWRFLFGILDYSKESTVNLIRLLLDATPNDRSFHIQCAYESQHSAASTEVLQFHDNNLMFNNIGHFDLACISYVLKTAEYTTIELSFFECNFSVDDAVALLKGVGDRQLSLTVFEGGAVQSVLEAFSLVSVPGLIKLDLWAATYGVGGVSLKSNLKLSSNLHKLRLSGVDFTYLGLEEGLKYCPSLEELCIAYTDCPLAVLEAIKHCINLVKLELWKCKLDVSKAQMLGQSLKFTSKLHFINLHENPLSDDGLLVLAEGIKNCKELKDLKLQDDNLTDESVPHLTELIESARNLEMLSLGNNKLRKTASPNHFTRGVEQIKKAVRERNSGGDMTELKLLIDEPRVKYT